MLALRLLAAGGLSLALLGQSADPLEIVTGPIQAADSPAARKAALDLLARARSNYALRTAGQGYRLETTFTIDSGGVTDYDGTWKMEDFFDPAQGVRWSAQSAAGDSITRLTVHDTTYSDGSLGAPSLRLHEVRAALFRNIPTVQSLERDSIRTSAAAFRGVALTCVLISGARRSSVPTSGRRWEEAEECIDPQSGLLQLSSQAPGRYIVYEYAGTNGLSRKGLPRKVTITEADKAVSTITVDSLTEISSAEPSLFTPTEAMRTRGEAVAMGEAQKISRVFGKGPFTADMEAHPVCVFGLVTPSGQLVEAHSLQPSDPNSAAAVEDAKRINYLAPAAEGRKAEQHFVFVIERFYSPKPAPSAY